MMAKRYVSIDEYGILVTNYPLVSYFRLYWWAHAVNKIVICMTTSRWRMNHSMNEFENSFILARVWETRTTDYCWFRFGVNYCKLQAPETHIITLYLMRIKAAICWSRDGHVMGLWTLEVPRVVFAGWLPGADFIMLNLLFNYCWLCPTWSGDIWFFLIVDKHVVIRCRLMIMLIDKIPTN